MAEFQTGQFHFLKKSVLSLITQVGDDKLTAQFH